MKLLKTKRPVKEIVEYLPTYVKNYYQPYIGDGAALLKILSTLRISGQIYVSDPDYRIVKLFRDIQNNFDEFIKGADLIHSEYSECQLIHTNVNQNKYPKDIDEAKQSAQSYYYWIQNSYNTMCLQEHDSTLMSVLYLFLQNIDPNKKQTTHDFYNASDIWAISVLIQPVVFMCQPAEVSLLPFEKNDFVYVDLPDNVALSVLKLCKTIPCNYILCSTENSQIHREFPLGFYNVERFPCGFDKISVFYQVLIRPNSPVSFPV